MKNANCINSQYPELDAGLQLPNPEDPNAPGAPIDQPGDGAVDWQTAIAFVDMVNNQFYHACTSDFGVDECRPFGGTWGRSDGALASLIISKSRS